ncbi:MAG: Gfo/Idh/MocA family oxidoreductase [Planctomycetes bacterium]|nr:Gfo/Idh/MocA family oxidoreductase [Planctomycetota bacterium]
MKNDEASNGKMKISDTTKIDVRMTLRVGIIGCGKTGEGRTGSAMGHQHAKGYVRHPNCQLVACADLVAANAEAFAKAYGGLRPYTDYREMLAREKLDMVSITVWTPYHHDIVVECARAGLRAVHCEKPMAHTFGLAWNMLRVCEEKGVQLTIDHQRRFGPPWRTARRLIDDGAVGEVTRLESACDNLFDWGTHWFDMMNFFNGDEPAEWVLGQIDCRSAQSAFGVPIENQGMSCIKWKNGVRGMLLTGYDMNIGCSNRILGTEGVIEVGVPNGPACRYRSQSHTEWQVPSLPDEPWYSAIAEGIADAIDALHGQREAELSGRKALQATELIFATYESSRRRARVDLPLKIEDHPLVSMLERGEVGAKEKPHE